MFKNFLRHPGLTRGEISVVRHLCLTFIFSLLFSTALAGPPQSNPAPQPPYTSVLTAPIRLFQHYLSGADGHRCPMTPSCSTYAQQAIARYGAIKGWIMASDRLMRCGRDELEHSPSVMTRHGLRCQDPVENNTFWLH
jgi:putative component of membrane protein insertase Oxa1/YidC/SpoIIIJ protein YidD